MEQVEKAARCVEHAWAVHFRRVRGSIESASRALAWLERFRVDSGSPRYREFRGAPAAHEIPIAVSSCDEFRAMRWFARSEVVLACDSHGIIYCIPCAELDGVPEVVIEPPGKDGAGPAYEQLI